MLRKNSILLVIVLLLTMSVGVGAYAEEKSQHGFKWYSVDPMNLMIGDEPKEITISGVSKYPFAKIIMMPEYGAEEYYGLADEKGEFSFKAGMYYPGGPYRFDLTVTSNGAKEGCIDAIDYKVRCEINTFAKPLPAATPVDSHEIEKIERVFTDSKIVEGKSLFKGKITLSIAEKEYVKETDEDGYFKLEIPKQTLGEQISIVISNVWDGMLLSPTEPILISVQLQKATAKKIKAKAKKITGTGYAGSKVKIYKGKKLLGKATCNKKGKYTVKVKKLKLLKKGVKIRLVSTAKAKGELYKSEATVKVK